MGKPHKRAHIRHQAPTGMSTPGTGTNELLIGQLQDNVELLARQNGDLKTQVTELQSRVAAQGEGKGKTLQEKMADDRFHEELRKGIRRLEVQNNNAGNIWVPFGGGQ